MAESLPIERLQPALLDRLTDDEPRNPNESRERRVMSMRQLRAAVLRDLAFLLNSPAHPPESEINDYPLVARSVLNFGMPDLSGQTASAQRAAKLETLVRRAVEMFEPRIIPGTLRVAGVKSGEDAGSRQTVAFELTGDVCPLPVPDALYVRTQMDLESGRCELTDRPA
ncbi:MAG: type VI secretion system baseplate subunit TssE [Phycisphaerales bacterium]|nr:type VI secretion system baseplate subunit TssE [Phycisphaerales bacterium]